MEWPWTERSIFDYDDVLTWTSSLASLPIRTSRLMHPPPMTCWLDFKCPFHCIFFQREDCDTFWAWILKNNHNERLETITEMFFTLLTRQKSFYTCHVEGVPRSHRGDLIDTFGKRDQAPRVANLQRWRIRSSDHPRWENNRKTSYLRVHSAARCSASRWFLLSTCDVKNRRIHKKYQKTKPTVQCSATVASRGSSGFGALQLTF